MASAQRLHLHRASSGAEGGRHVQNVFSEFYDGQEPCIRRQLCRPVPGERLRYTDTFDDPNLPGQMQVTVTLKKVSVGTEIDIEQGGIPDLIPPEACHLGWQELLRNLARLVEPEINQ